MSAVAEVVGQPVFDKPGVDRHRRRRKETVKRHRRRRKAATHAQEHAVAVALDAGAELDGHCHVVATNGAKPTVNAEVGRKAAKARDLIKRAKHD